mgnify:CR=1 FL=1
MHKKRMKPVVGYVLVFDNRMYLTNGGFVYVTRTSAELERRSFMGPEQWRVAKVRISEITK